jgi:hypothetical protein
MEINVFGRIHLIARGSLAFVFIYHGLVPKILWLSPIEVNLVSAHGLNATLVSPLAGVFEILLGCVIVLFWKSLLPIYLAISILVVLLVDVVFVMPTLLVEAFNPVTLNLVTIVIAYIIVITQKYIGYL